MQEIVKIEKQFVVQDHATRMSYPFDTKKEAEAKLAELTGAKAKQKTVAKKTPGKTKSTSAKPKADSSKKKSQPKKA